MDTLNSFAPEDDSIATNTNTTATTTNNNSFMSEDDTNNSLMSEDDTNNKNNNNSFMSKDGNTNINNILILKTLTESLTFSHDFPGCGESAATSYKSAAIS